MNQPEIEKGLTIEHPPHGFVTYRDHLGSDLRVVEAARTSFGTQASKGDAADKKLLEYLFRNRHTSPFEQCNITYHIKFPVFLMRQFVRHRMFRLNEFSARYAEMPDQFYLPKDWRKRDSTNKQGSVEVEDWNATAGSTYGAGLSKNQYLTQIAERQYQEAYRTYELLLNEGVAKEMARFVLPVGIYTQIVVNCDLHNLMHFFRLRLDPHAQQEIRVVAGAMFVIAGKLFPWTIAAYNRYTFEMKDNG